MRSNINHCELKPSPHRLINIRLFSSILWAIEQNDLSCAIILQSPSLDLLLGKKYPHLVNKNLEHGFYFVHRLDYVTSGVICIALNKRACAAASSAFQKRISRKYYIALLRGHVSVNRMDLINPIGKMYFITSIIFINLLGVSAWIAWSR